MTRILDVMGESQYFLRLPSHALFINQRRPAADFASSRGLTVVDF